MSPETVRYLLSLDLKMLETTSQTEQAGFPQCINSIQPGGFRIGRVGRAYPDQCEVKLINVDQAGSHNISLSLMARNVSLVPGRCCHGAALSAWATSTTGRRPSRL